MVSARLTICAAFDSTRSLTHSLFDYPRDMHKIVVAGYATTAAGAAAAVVILCIQYVQLQRI